METSVVSGFSRTGERRFAEIAGMRTGNPGHLKAFDYLGLHRYSLTFCTDRRQKLFTTQDVVDLVLEQIARAAAEYQFEITAYCFMPDHLHLLVEGQERRLGREAVHRAREAVFRLSTTRQARGSKLWQRYGFEHVLRDDELTLVVAKYILENPVRAGLVEAGRGLPVRGIAGVFAARLAGGDRVQVRLKPDTTGDRHASVQVRLKSDELPELARQCPALGRTYCSATGRDVLQRRLILPDRVEQRLGDLLPVGIPLQQLRFLRVGHEAHLRQHARHVRADQDDERAPA